VVPVYPRSVLIADDDPGLRESLGEVLGREGWETHLAEDGRQAISVIRVRLVTVALVDMRMPDMTGLEALQEMHRIMALLPVIAMTADRDRWVKADLLAAGAFDLLWKPLRRAEVVGALERALRMAGPRRTGDGSGTAGVSGVELS
jgi:DNA-binding NtrC family response regulator